MNISAEVNATLTQHQQRTQQQHKINLDSIWKKTIQQINKDKNLNLTHTSIQQNNLMIYKWCERAQNLNIDDPLLVIYWQKFFILYFSMRYLNTQINYFNINVNLSSYIKHVKLNLENLNKQFNAKLTNNLSMSAHVREFYLKLSQIFYAFTLWIDETRLYDLNLDINGLPKHYLSNLLESLFMSPTELWFNLLNINDISQRLKKAIKTSLCAIDNERTRLDSRTNKQHNELFFLNKMQTDCEAKADGSGDLYAFEYPLKEQLGVLLTHEKLTHLHGDDIEYMKKLCEHLLNQICLYNNEMIVSNLNAMKSLDDLYIQKYLPNLYKNELCEKYVQVPCKSLLNPMHTCTRAALIKFVYEQKEKHAQTKLELKENRKKYQKILQIFNLDDFPQQNCVKSMLTLNSLIKKLIANFGLNPNLIENLLNFIFYLILNTYEMSLSKFNEDFHDEATATDDPTGNSDLNSINLYLIDLINLIGHFNFKRNSNSLRFLLSFILNKISTEKFNNRLIMLLVEYLSPNQENLIDFYKILLGSFDKFLKAKQQQAIGLDQPLLTTQFNVYLNLFKKFSLEKLKCATNLNEVKITDLYTYVELNNQFLLNFSSYAKVENRTLFAVIEQILENLIALCTINYPFHLEYVLRNLMDLSAQQQLRHLFEQVNNRHLKIFLNYFKKFELLQPKTVVATTRDSGMNAGRIKNFLTFLNQFFGNECAKFAKLSVKENTFLLHWVAFINELLDIFDFLIDMTMQLSGFDLKEVLSSIEMLYVKWFYEPMRMDKSSMYYFKLFTEVCFSRKF